MYGGEEEGAIFLGWLDVKQGRLFSRRAAEKFAKCLNAFCIEHPLA